MRRLLALAGLILAATGCASPPLEEPPFGAPPPPAAAPAPPPSATPSPPRGPPLADACGAAELQHLLGHPRTEVPVPIDPSRQRVACTTCPVTQDYRPDRLNFFFDAQTGVIREIRCG